MTSIRNQVFLLVASLAAVGVYSRAALPPQEIQDVEEQMAEQEEAMADMESDMRDVEVDAADMDNDVDNDADDAEAGQ
jgi:hypothetical protein